MKLPKAMTQTLMKASLNMWLCRIYVPESPNLLRAFSPWSCPFVLALALPITSPIFHVFPHLTLLSRPIVTVSLISPLSWTSLVPILNLLVPSRAGKEQNSSRWLFTVHGQTLSQTIRRGYTTFKVYTEGWEQGMMTFVWHIKWVVLFCFCLFFQVDLTFSTLSFRSLFMNVL